MQELTETTDKGNFTPAQVRSYEDSLKYYRDLKNSLDTARDEGKEEGKIEGKLEGKIEREIEIAIEMLKANEPIDKVMRFTGLTQEQIEQLF